MPDRSDDVFSGDELQRATLLARFFDGDLSDAELADWDRSLAESEETREILVAMCLQRQLLQHILSDSTEDEQMLATCGAAAPGGMVLGMPGTLGDSAVPAFLPVSGTTDDSGRGLAGYFWQETPFSYLVATVVVAIGLWIGSVISTSRPEQVVQTVAPHRTEREQETVTAMEFVGRITGMVDCRWSDPNTAVPGPVAVPLGRKYALASGLLEITYESGAKVILQGPCTYEVESAAGGYLSLGKLTAKVEKKAKSGKRKAEDESASSAFSFPLSAFTVRTPTATVTDLGTEFGVEVGESGATATHVFRGVVEVQPGTKNGEHRGSAVRLKTNESVRVEKQKNGVDATLEVHRSTADAAAFVRADQLPTLAEESRLRPSRRWKTYSQELRNDPALVAYYTFESAGTDNAKLPNVSAAGHALDGQVNGAEWVQGRLPGKSALYFHGKGSQDVVILPYQERFNFTQPFSLCVWFQVAQFRPDTVPALITRGGPGWRLQRFRSSTNCMTIDPGVDDLYKLQPHAEVTDRRWHLAVGVIEPLADSHRKCLYVDGCMDSDIEFPGPLGPSDHPIWVGASSLCADREFEGRIDEVAILARALSAVEIEAMFTAGNPANTVAKQTNNRK